MKTDLFDEYLLKAGSAESGDKVEMVFDWIESEFPQLKPDVKWGTPLYTYHGTFIIGVKPAKNHFSINPEVKGIQVFSDNIKASGYTHAAMTYKIKYNDEVDYKLLKDIIEYNIEDKKYHDKFWR